MLLPGVARYADMGGWGGGGSSSEQPEKRARHGPEREKSGFDRAIRIIWPIRIMVVLAIEVLGGLAMPLFLNTSFLCAACCLHGKAF